MAMKAPTKYILSLDGGGVRGLATAEFLVSMEDGIKSAGLAESLAEMFDLIAGTSAGALIAAAVGAGDNQSAREVRDAFKQRASYIMPRQGIKRFTKTSKRPPELQRALDKYVKVDRQLAECETPVLIPAVDSKRCELVVYSTLRGDTSRLHDAVLGSIAAPTYLPPHETRWNGRSVELVDGGLAANNPVLVAVKEARKFFPDSPLKVISIGTGSGTPRGIGGRSRNLDNLIQRRPHRMVTNLFEVVMTTQSRMSADLAASEIGDDGLLRMEPSFKDGPPELDDSSAETLEACISAGRALWDKERVHVLDFLDASP